MARIAELPNSAKVATVGLKLRGEFVSSPLCHIASEIKINPSNHPISVSDPNSYLPDCDK